MITFNLIQRVQRAEYLESRIFDWIFEFGTKKVDQYILDILEMSGTDLTEGSNPTSQNLKTCQKNLSGSKGKKGNRKKTLTKIISDGNLIFFLWDIIFFYQIWCWSFFFFSVLDWKVCFYFLFLLLSRFGVLFFCLSSQQK